MIDNDDDDVIKAISKTSKVSSKKKEWMSNALWIGGAMVAVVAYLYLSSGHTQQSAKLNQTKTYQTDYSDTLNMNLARLKQMNQARPQQDSMPSQSSFDLLPRSNEEKKEYLARQNAPIGMSVPDFNSEMSSHSGTVTQRGNGSIFAGHGSNAQFGNTAFTSTSVEAEKIAHPSYTVVSGELLHANLITAINSSLPGMVTAVLSRPVYSYTGERVLMPGGSRLMGQYSSSIVQGQSRVMVIWERAILPNGITIQLNSPGTDALGRAGIGGDVVDRHFWERFGEAGLLSLIGAGAANAGVGAGDQLNSASQYRASIAQSFQQSAQQSLQNTLPIKPTIYIHQGRQINIFVAHDLDFYGVLHKQEQVAW